MPALWLALRFPSLPLEIYARGCADSVPLAIVARSGAHADVIACNGPACQAGVRAGMPAAAAAVLTADLQTLTRDAPAERAALERLAAWAIQFTPVVSLTAEAELLLEIGGSLKLYGGLNRLWAEVEQGLQQMGYRADMACAPTPLAAQLFARAGWSLRIRNPDALHASIEKLPVKVLNLPAPEATLLQDIGAVTIGEFLQLPRDGLARRVGPEILAAVDRALGRLSDPRAHYTPPSRFTAAQALPAPAQDAGMLLFAARRLLIELCGYLSATTQGVQQLTFILAHHGRADTCLDLALVTASRDIDHLTNVLRERLGRTRLPCPVTSIALVSELLLPLASSTAQFFPDRGNQTEAAAQLIERLRARVGDAAVQGLQLQPDYRPERAWGRCTPGESCNALFLNNYYNRPLWLLPTPHRLQEISGSVAYDGRLTLLAGPERLETGWWDGDESARDYFLASNPAHALLWIYRQRTGDPGWFLHGFFG